LNVEQATSADLEQILSWLEREYREHGEGFWDNEGVIRSSLESEDLWVVRENGEAVALQVGRYPEIVSVRKDKQNQGFGTALFEASLARALSDNVNMLSGVCSPRSSFPFWQRRGFERYGSMSDAADPQVRLVLHRELDVPKDLPRAEVTVPPPGRSAVFPPPCS